MKNKNKTAIAKITKVLNTINFNNKYGWAIDIGDIDTT